MKVVLTGPAVSDLRAIVAFASERGHAQASIIADDILECCNSLAHFPLRCPLVPRYQHRNIRRLVAGRHLIFFRAKGDLVEVLHILHGAQDFERILSLDR